MPSAAKSGLIPTVTLQQTSLNISYRFLTGLSANLVHYVWLVQQKNTELVYVRTFVNPRSNTRRLVGVVRTITLVWGKLGSLRYGSRSDLSDQAWQRADFVWLLMWRPGCCQTVSMYGIGVSVTHHS